MSSNIVGRPRGKKKTSKIEITIEPEIKEEFMKSLHENNQYASIVLREWIIDYIKIHGVEK
ncbi:hypothetical protein [Ferdinandcohnia sp. Marseille-Q9671]